MVIHRGLFSFFHMLILQEPDFVNFILKKGLHLKSYNEQVVCVPEPPPHLLLLDDSNFHPSSSSTLRQALFAFSV